MAHESPAKLSKLDVSLDHPLCTAGLDADADHSNIYYHSDPAEVDWTELSSVQFTEDKATQTEIIEQTHKGPHHPKLIPSGTDTMMTHIS